jgi:lipoate-protein ligase B
MDILTACHLGPTPYREGLALQEALVSARSEGATGDWLLFPDHPPVLTVGRTGGPESLKADAATLRARGVEVFEVARGGDITWHGPGQLVAYPIVGLSRVGRDLHVFLRHLEGAVIETLEGWGLAGQRVAGRTGVWVEGEKIASIGIAVRRWVGYHGIALNVAPDLAGFDLIHPCGLRDVRMTSMSRRLGPRCPSLAEVRAALAEHLARRLGYGQVEWAPSSTARSVRWPAATAALDGAAASGGRG